MSIDNVQAALQDHKSELVAEIDSLQAQVQVVDNTLAVLCAGSQLSAVRRKRKRNLPATDTPTCQQVLAAIRASSSPMTAAQVCEATGLHQTTSHRALKALREAGLTVMTIAPDNTHLNQAVPEVTAPESNTANHVWA